MACARSSSTSISSRTRGPSSSFPAPTRRRAAPACPVPSAGATASPFAGDPRSVLERALAAATAAGFDYRVALEVEFYLLRQDAAGPLPPDAGGYFGVGEDLIAGTRDEILATLHEMGIEVGGAHHETGPGQEELDLWPAGALRMADQVLTVRQVVRAVAQRRGLRATFMPKPLSDAPGSGMHVFQRLARLGDGADALRDERDDLSASAATRSPDSSRTRAAPARSSARPSTPTSASPPATAPRHATWARVSQASLIRVPASASSEEAALELELRSPDAMANPYLALAVTLACALDGIRQGEEPPDPRWTRRSSATTTRSWGGLGVPPLPVTLGDALAALTEDDIVRAAIGDYVCDQLLLVKRAEGPTTDATSVPGSTRGTASGEPRSVLERALAAETAAGYDYRVALEVVFYRLRQDAAGPRPPDAGGYFDVGEDLIAGTRDVILATLHEMGIGVGGAHHETGPGQEELDLWPAGALRMADQVMTVRQVVRSVAGRRGLRATFMPKPLSDAPGSGMHVFQRLARLGDGADALRDERDDLSSVGRHAIAGQLTHASAMCAVVCPTVNSYKRLAAGHRAPRHATWARVSQASLIRVPSSASSAEAALELELRSPDACANPYLALAVTLACALDGIRQGEEPPDPLDETLIRYDDAELGRLGVPPLPATLGDALAALTEDDIVRAAIGDYVCDQLLLVKRAEWDDYRRYVSPWEHARYGD